MKIPCPRDEPGVVGFVVGVVVVEKSMIRSLTLVDASSFEMCLSEAKVDGIGDTATMMLDEFE